MLPYPWQDNFASKAQPLPRSSSSRIHSNLHNRAGEKIRDLRRILRSVPGVTPNLDNIDIMKSNADESPTIPSRSPRYNEVCHLLQYIIGTECLHMAQNPYVISGKGVKFCSGHESEWLALHATPDKMLPDDE
eukprot:12957831-Ditylum_brightwellii.AAC.1